MSRRVFRLSGLEPLEKLRLRRNGAYTGTVTEPGDLVSDGKLIFAADRIPEERQALAREVASRSGVIHRRVSQDEAGRVFGAIAREAARRAQLLGQAPKPLWVNATDLEAVAVLRYGRGGSTGYVFVDAYRLLLLQHLTGFDEIRCGGPGSGVLLRRGGEPVGGMTALQMAPEVTREPA